MNSAKPLSATVGLDTVRVGASSSSVIVAVPSADAFEVVPALVVAVSVKVSSPSKMVSVLIGVRTRALVSPAAKVAVVASTQLVPSKTCRLPRPPVP